MMTFSHEFEYHYMVSKYFSGNEMGAILLHNYICGKQKATEWSLMVITLIRYI